MYIVWDVKENEILTKISKQIPVGTKGKPKYCIIKILKSENKARNKGEFPIPKKLGNIHLILFKKFIVLIS